MDFQSLWYQVRLERLMREGWSIQFTDSLNIRYCRMADPIRLFEYEFMPASGDGMMDDLRDIELNFLHQKHSQSVRHFYSRSWWTIRDLWRAECNLFSTDNDGESVAIIGNHPFPVTHCD
jgi:hypothetical protein